ncbi:MAG: hypothetical protein E3K37_01465 [Candidatus Kuenenia sp.]|nr:hypothetical protein [Candidatus Kuenenia hertensis]
MISYVDNKGNIVKVSKGISDSEWMSCCVKKTGSLKRIKSKYLPLRSTKREALQDLTLYASKKKWRRYIPDGK